MALWKLLNLGTGCTVTQCGEGLHCGVTSQELTDRLCFPLSDKTQIGCAFTYTPMAVVIDNNLPI